MFAGLGSVGAELIVAVSAIEPLAVGLTVMVTVTLWLTARGPSAQVTTPAAFEQPADALTNVKDEGKASERVVLVVALGPLFFTVKLRAIEVPTVPLAEPFGATDTSAEGEAPVPESVSG